MRYRPKRKYLDQFVTTLKTVATTEEVDMLSTEPGNCGTPGCHGWLVAKALSTMEGVKPPSDETYYFSRQAYRLEIFLETGKFATPLELEDAPCPDQSDLSIFAGQHPKWWGNTHGERMFYNNVAFLPQGQERSTLTELSIYNWWAEVAKRPLS